MEKTLRWGILSTARINRAMITALRVTKRNQLAAIASRSLENARDYAREWNIPTAYGSYEALLADPAIDVVYIPLPNHLHMEWVLKAAAAGKHVLCEKPIALSVADVDSIQAAARQYQVHIAEGFMYRHHPQTLKVKELVAAGEIGEVSYIQGSFSFPLNRPEDYRWQPDQGGGSLWDVGCYPLSYAMLIAGTAPVEVMGWQKLAPSGVDATFVGQLRFASGLLAHIQSSFVLPKFARMELRGSTGTLLIPTPFRSQENHPFSLRQEKEKVYKVKGVELFRGEVENMADVILDGKPARLALEESRRIIQSLVGLYESARTNRPVLLK